LEFSLTNHELIYLGKEKSTNCTFGILLNKPPKRRDQTFEKFNLLYLSEGNCSIAKSKFVSLKKQLKNVGKSTYCNQCG
jgi:hypothetical protein